MTRDLPSQDSLLDALLLIALGHGRPLTRDTAIAGLPLIDGRLTPALVGRAAERAGLSTRIAQTPIGDLDPEVLPVIALLKGDRAMVVLGRDGAAGTVRLRDPGAGGAEVQLPLAQVEELASGTVILIRPEFRFDARSPEVVEQKSRHWFWSVIAENARLYRDAFFGAALVNLFAVALPLFAMNVYDRVVPNQATDTLWVLAIGVVVVLFGDLVLRTVRGHFLDLAGDRVDVELSAYIMQRVLGLRMAERPISAGSFAANLRSFEQVRDFVTSATIAALIDLPFTFLFIIVIAWIDWPLVIPPLVGIALVLGYAWTIQTPLREMTESTYRAGTHRNALLIESLVGLESIKTLGAEGSVQRKWEETATYLATMSTRLRLLSTATMNATMATQQLVYVSLVVLGVYLIINHQLSMGGLIAVTTLSSRTMGPVNQVAGLMLKFHSARTALVSLDEIMGRGIERPPQTRFISRPQLKGEIVFKDVSFRYPGQENPSLRGVNLRIAPGERVGIIGRIGSGKSTLHRMILGLYQAEQGAVLIDGIDIRQLDPAELRRNIGCVDQDVMLFYGSLSENLRLGVPTASDEALVRAIGAAGLAEFVNAHPMGFDMAVGERGDTLSGGQRQGIGIARALLRDAPILLLDEPTGAMDHSTEETVKKHLVQAMPGKTVLLITHRNTLLDLVDRLIVIDAGRIVADGPKERVVAALRSGQIGKAA